MEHLNRISKKDIIYLIIFIVTFTSRSFSQAVEIEGNLRLLNRTPVIDLVDNSRGTKVIRFTMGGSDNINLTAYTGDLIFQTDRIDRMLISHSTGDIIMNKNLGIGITNPKNRLSFPNVIGPKINLFDDGIGIYGFGIGPAELQIGAYDNNKHISLGHFSGTSKTFSEWVQINNGGLSMASGAHVTRGGVWTNASSRSYKENIEKLDLDVATSSIMALDPVTYNYKVQPNEDYLGFIAEDVPDLFATEDRKGLSSMDILSALVKVVQDQQARIAELELLLSTKE